MKTVKVKVYEYAELNDEAKEKARQWLLEGGMDYQWAWEGINNDSESVGLKITEMDPQGQGRSDGRFIGSAIETALKIVKEHGKTCETYKTAKAYLEAVKALGEEPEDGWSVSEEARLEDLEDEFLRGILSDYRINARKEMEYVESEEYMAETMEANGYTFTKDGKRFG